MQLNAKEPFIVRVLILYQSDGLQVRSGNVSMGQLAQAEPAGIADDSCYEKEDAKFSDAEKGHAMLPIFKHTTDSPEFNLHPKHSNHKPAQGWTPDRGQGDNLF